MLAKLDPTAEERIRRSIGDVLPELADYIVGHQFGALLERPALDLKTRMLASIAALTALGHARPQLEFHLRAARNVGCTDAEIVEAIYQTLPYVGVPAVVNALGAAKGVLVEGAGQ